MIQDEAHEQNEEGESSGTYSKEILFYRKKYQKILAKKMKVAEQEGFRRNFLSIFKSKNIQYFGTNIQEISIPGNIAEGQVELPLITLDQVRQKIRQLPDKD